MSDSNRIQIAYVKESIRGITPDSPLEVLNVASESLVGNASSTQSTIVQASGNLKDSIRTDFQPAGGINTELGFDFNNEFIEGAFRSAFGTPVSISGITFAMVPGSPITITDSGSGLAGLTINDMIWVTGFADENNNGAFVVTASAAGTIDVVPVDASKTVTSESAGATVSIKTTRMANDNTSSTFSIERFYSDVSHYMSWLGMEVDTMALSFGASSPATIAFTFLGEKHPPITATIGNGTRTAASTNPVMDTVDGYLGTLLSVGGATLTNAVGCVTNVTYNIANGVRSEQGLNCKTIGKGDFNLTVSFDIVFKDLTYYKAFQDNSIISLASGVTDSNDKGYGIVIPTLKLTSASAPLSGANQTTTGSYQAQAIGSTVDGDVYTAIFSILE